jgi:hypothetical protein
MRPIVVMLYCLLVVAIPVRMAAALSWDQLDLSATPKATDSTAVLVYHFTNTGVQAVTILAIKTSCSCTAAKMSKTVFQPGEKGSIRVTFTIGARGGDQSKQVLVTSDNSQHPVDTLQLLIHLPPAPVFNHRLLVWYIGDPIHSQSVTIDIPDNVSMAVTKVLPAQSSHVTVSCTLKTITPGKSYEVEVTPSTTVLSGYATIDVLTTTKTYHLFVRIVANPSSLARSPASAAQHSTPASSDEQNGVDRF